MLVVCSLLFFHVGFISSQWLSGTSHAQRGEKTVLNCFKEMDKENDIAHLLLDISSPPKIDQFCRKMTELMQCIAENEHHLSTAENTSYLRRTRGVYQFYLNVCPPGTEITEKYKLSAPCFKLMRNQILSCGSELSPILGDDKQNDRSKCCALKEYRDCMTSAAEKKCGPEASATLDKLLLRYYQVELSGCEHFTVEECHLAETTPYKKVTGYGHDDEKEIEPKFNRWPDFKTTESGYHAKDYESWKKEKGKHGGGSGLAGSAAVLLTALAAVFFRSFGY